MKILDIRIRAVTYVTHQMGATDVRFGSKADIDECLGAMSALPPEADIRQGNRDVRFVPKADIVIPFNEAAHWRISNQNGHRV
jgi:hypothetical protein